MTVLEPGRRRLGRPPDTDSATTRQRLLAGARRAFAEHGFDATTNRQIAEAADVTATAIYHYFDSKAELYAAVFVEVQELVEASFQASVDGQRGFVASLDAALDTVVSLNRVDASLSGFLVSARMDLPRHPELRALLGRRLGRGSSFLRQLARDAQAAGELPADMDLRALEDLLNIVLLGLARFSNETGDPDRHEAAIRVLQRFLSAAGIGGSG